MSPLAPSNGAVILTTPGEEWFEATCAGASLDADGELIPCDRHWSARGTIASRRAAARAQKHSDRTGHMLDAQWANRRPAP